MRLTLFAVLVGLVPVARPSPLQPLTLWELVERSDLIVLADVEGVDAASARVPGQGTGTPHQARLRVVERWKGDGPAAADRSPFRRTSPVLRRRSSSPGQRVLAFLAHEQGRAGERRARLRNAVSAHAGGR